MKKYIAIFSLISALTTGAAQAEEVKQTFDGKTINANVVYADGKAFGDKVVLLLHGTLTHNARSTYTELQNNLAKLGVSSLAMNLSLGLNDRHGEYDCATPHTHKHTDALKEIGAWQTWLKEHGVKQFTLVGHSRGGNQAEWYATEHDSPMLSKVVLLAPATKEQQSAKEYQEKYGKKLADVLKQANTLVKAGKGNELMQNVDFIYCEKTQATAAAVVDYYAVKPQFDTPTLLKKAKKPTLVLIASEDQYVPDLPARTSEFKGNKNVSTMIIDGADHFFIDLANEDAAAAIADFISK